MFTIQCFERAQRRFTNNDTNNIGLLSSALSIIFKNKMMQITFVYYPYFERGHRHFAKNMQITFVYYLVLERYLKTKNDATNICLLPSALGRISNRK